MLPLRVLKKSFTYHMRHHVRYLDVRKAMRVHVFLNEIPEELLDLPERQYATTIGSRKRQPAKRGFSQRAVKNSASSSTASNWKVGDKVMHKSWGEGMVSNVNDKNGSIRLDIIFKSEGPKRLLAQFAPIEKKED